MRDWLDGAQEIVDRGKAIYLRDDLLLDPVRDHRDEAQTALDVMA